MISQHCLMAIISLYYLCRHVKVYIQNEREMTTRESSATTWWVWLVGECWCVGKSVVGEWRPIKNFELRLKHHRVCFFCYLFSAWVLVCLMRCLLRASQSRSPVVSGRQRRRPWRRWSCLAPSQSWPACTCAVHPAPEGPESCPAPDAWRGRQHESTSVSASGSCWPQRHRPRACASSNRGTCRTQPPLCWPEGCPGTTLRHRACSSAEWPPWWPPSAYYGGCWLSVPGSPAERCSLALLASAVMCANKSPSRKLLLFFYFYFIGAPKLMSLTVCHFTHHTVCHDIFTMSSVSCVWTVRHKHLSRLHCHQLLHIGTVVWAPQHPYLTTKHFTMTWTCFTLNIV